MKTMYFFFNVQNLTITTKKQTLLSSPSIQVHSRVTLINVITEKQHSLHQRVRGYRSSSQASLGRFHQSVVYRDPRHAGLGGHVSQVTAAAAQCLWITERPLGRADSNFPLATSIVPAVWFILCPHCAFSSRLGNPPRTEEQLFLCVRATTAWQVDYCKSSTAFLLIIVLVLPIYYSESFKYSLSSTITQC